MGKLYIDLFTTLDGVAQAPGGPDEDLDGGFRFGGWQAPHMDELIGESVSAGIETMDALLLGRRTYEIFAAYWPHHRADVGIQLNAMLPNMLVARNSTNRHAVVTGAAVNSCANRRASGMCACSAEGGSDRGSDSKASIRRHSSARAGLVAR